MSLAYVQFVVAVTLALLASWAALMVSVSLLLPDRAEAAERALTRAPKRCAALGVVALIAFIVAAIVSKSPAPPIKLVAVLAMLAIGGLLILGAAGMTRVMADRIARMTGARGGVGTLLGAGLIFSFALVFPILGWSVFTPLAGLVSMGAGTSSMIGWLAETRERRAVKLTVSGRELSEMDERRIGAALAIGVGAALAGCRALDGRIVPPPPTYERPPAGPEAAFALHALNRLAFGPRPGDVAHVARIGATAYIEEQLADKLDEDPIVPWRVSALDIQQLQADQPDVLSSMEDTQLLTETQQAAILRAVYSRRQLHETLADFWTNHFNIYALKNDGRVLIPTDTERVIRPNVLGKFRDLLNASAHSPAMLGYLDNQANRKGVANENYARELLELHTLGVHSGYSQRDIQEVARCLTGWTVTGGFNAGKFRYDPDRHDNGAKFIPFLNLRIAPGGGERDASDVIDRLAMHPTTARFLSTKLCMRYLGAAPKPIVDLATRAYLRNDTDIRATLRPILLDGLITSYGATPIVKRPIDFAISALRALAADTDGGEPLQRHLASMGQPLYQWPMPDGFPERTTAWTGSLLGRWNFALALTANAIDGTRVDLDAPLRSAGRSDPDVDAVVEAIYGRRTDDSTLDGLWSTLDYHVTAGKRAGVNARRLNAERVALALAAPAFQWR